MKKFWSYLKGWRGLALIAYMWLILMAWVVVFVDVRSEAMTRRFYIVSVAEVLFFALMYICPRILRKAEKINIIPDTKKLTRAESTKFFMYSWLVSFGILFVIYIIFYPGGFSPDSITQYMQATGIMKYNDWHPVLHTLFTFVLPLKIFGGWIGSIILFQIIIGSLSIAYMAECLAEYGNIKFAKLFLFLTAANPVTLQIMMYPWKDVTFAIFSMLAMTFAVRVHFTAGSWMNDIKYVVIFIIVISAATIFRHNAILFTFPLLIAVMLYVKCWRKLFLLVGFCACILIVRLGLYSYLDVEKPGYRVVETVGMPMTIIGTAIHETPESLDKYITEFAYSLAPKEIWEENAQTGSFSMKSFIDKDMLEKNGYAKILSVMVRCFTLSPMASLRGFCALSNMVYGIAGPTMWGMIPKIEENSYGIKAGGIPFLQKIINLLTYANRILAKYLFWHLGLYLLVIFIVILVKSHFDKVADWKKLCLVLPLFMYDFGTMLLLSTTDFRFFYCTHLIFPLVILLLLRDENEAAS